MNQQKLKAKISQIAGEQGTTFNDIWHRLVMERFLARLAASPSAANFIFKGGYLLMHYTGSHRQTRDLDFLVHGFSAERDSLAERLTTLSSMIVDDGFRFELIGIEDLRHDHMKYQGYSAKLVVSLEQMRETLEIDFGVGDDVVPIEEAFELLHSTAKGPIFESEISLKVYPPEFIFSEKLETAVTRGAVNSRMKDYHDMYVLIQSGLVDSSATRKAISRTFAKRGTDASLLPLSFDEQQVAQLSRLWSPYRRKGAAVPAEFGEVLRAINSFVAP